MARVLAEVDADVICLTEGFAGLLPGGGHVVDGEAHTGHPNREGQRRVLLWSRHPWRDVDGATQARMPHQGFVSAVTDSPGGPMRVLGLCIPWSHAGLRDGQGRRAWDVHGDFLRELAQVIADGATQGPLAAAGDFNQFLRCSTAAPGRAAARTGRAAITTASGWTCAEWKTRRLTSPRVTALGQIGQRSCVHGGRRAPGATLVLSPPGLQVAAVGRGEPQARAA